MVFREVLKRTAHLSNLDEETLTRLASIAEDRVVAANDTVFADMDPAEFLFLVLDGEINICCEMGSGEMRVMDTVNEGELFAWSALVEPYRYTSTAIAVRESHLVAFDAKKLREFCEEDLDLGFQLLSQIVELLSNRLESVRVQLAAV